MHYGSVCSGIEAASVAWEQLGWQASWFAEIEPFPSAVLAHRYSAVPNLGDMTLLPERIAAGEIEAPDVLVGGTPCQGFSVAGLRQSLRDERSNLAFSFVRIADAIDGVRLRDGRPAAWITWENVPGVFTHDDNPFGCFLGALVGSDAAIVPPRGNGWPDAGVAHGPRRCAAWRCLDAQHFRLAQRRKRLFVVARGYFGGAGEWDGPDALLPVIESMRWHSAPRREAGKDVTGSLSASTKGGGGLGTDFELEGVSPSLRAQPNHSHRESDALALCLNAKGGGRTYGR